MTRMVLEAKNISKRYRKNGRFILKDFNLSIENNKLLVIKGQSGCGKSTLLAILGGYLKPDSGQVTYNGININEINNDKLASIHYDKIGYLPQSNVMLKELKVIDNIVLAAKLVKGNNKEEFIKKAEDMLAELDIKELADSYPYELSGGELKRVSLIRSIITEPQVLIADEPTTGLDTLTAKKILDYIKAYKEKGNIVVIASHDENAEKYGDAVLDISDIYHK